MNNALFGITLTLLSFLLSIRISRYIKNSFANPLFISIILIIGTLSVLNIDYEDYKKQTEIFTLFINPVQSIVIGVSLYKEYDLLKKYFLPIITTTVLSTIFVTAVVFFLSKALKMPEDIILSSLPKSITTAVGLEISSKMGWITSITMMYILISGITGAVFAPLVLRLTKTKTKLSKGLAIGISSHALGTTKALEMGEVEGSSSALAIATTAIATAFYLPLFVKIIIALKLI